MAYIVNDLKELQLKCLKTIISVPTTDTRSEIFHYFNEKLSKEMSLEDTKLIDCNFSMVLVSTLKSTQTEFVGMDSKITVPIAIIAHGWV